jgi:peptide/nickel transport system substrate-binding protein
MLSSGYAAESAYNDSGWQNERFNMLLVEARAELDRAKRAEMYREMQGIVRDDAATLITTFGNYVMALRNNVQHGEKVSGSWGLDGGRAVERWWLDG